MGPEVADEEEELAFDADSTYGAYSDATDTGKIPSWRSISFCEYLRSGLVSTHVLRVDCSSNRASMEPCSSPNSTMSGNTDSEILMCSLSHIKHYEVS